MHILAPHAGAIQRPQLIDGQPFYLSNPNQVKKIQDRFIEAK